MECDYCFVENEKLLLLFFWYCRAVSTFVKMNGLKTGMEELEVRREKSMATATHPRVASFPRSTSRITHLCDAFKLL